MYPTHDSTLLAQSPRNLWKKRGRHVNNLPRGNWFLPGAPWPLSLSVCHPHPAHRLPQLLPDLLITWDLHNLCGRPEAEQPRGLRASQGMCPLRVLGWGGSGLQALSHQVLPLHGALRGPVSHLPEGQPPPQWVTFRWDGLCLSPHLGNYLSWCLVPSRYWCLSS